MEEEGLPKLPVVRKQRREAFVAFWNRPAKRLGFEESLPAPYTAGVLCRVHCHLNLERWFVVVYGCSILTASCTWAGSTSAPKKQPPGSQQSKARGTKQNPGWRSERGLSEGSVRGEPPVSGTLWNHNKIIPLDLSRVLDSLSCAEPQRKAVSRLCMPPSHRPLVGIERKMTVWPPWHRTVIDLLQHVFHACCDFFCPSSDEIPVDPQLSFDP